MEIRKLERKELNEALTLVWEVFSQYEAVHYDEHGKRVFWEAIHDERYLDTLSAYGAFEEQKLLGILASRENDAHLALFFVKGSHHRRGIGRALWKAFHVGSNSRTITVNSSLFEVPIYGRLGFVQAGERQEEGGISYVPMRYCR